jgi:hypothetical protein
MKRPLPLWEWQTHTNDPVTSGDLTLRTEAQALVMVLPWGGFVWKRPTAVHVTRSGVTQRLPIVDPTRIVLLILAGISLGVTLGVAIARVANRSTPPPV